MREWFIDVSKHACGHMLGSGTMLGIGLLFGLIISSLNFGIESRSMPTECISHYYPAGM